MKVAFVDLKAQYDEIGVEISSTIQSVVEDTAFVGGKYLKGFEGEFAKYIGAEHCIGVGNGTDAIFVALKALGIMEGDEVITVANTFIATSEAITNARARVVFVDCHESTYNIDVGLIDEKITKKTKAIIPVHLYGQPADMDPIMDLARKYNLSVIEDCAQAHGATYKGRTVGMIGNCGCFSFFPGKNLGAYGDAGAVVTDNQELAMKVRMFANHGRIEKYNHEQEGVNSRLDSLQAAILSVKLKHLDRWNSRRVEIAMMYDHALADVVETPKIMNEAKSVYHLYVIRVDRRDELKKKMGECGISTGIHYPIPLPFLKAYKYLEYKPDDMPVSFNLKDKILSLPIHGSMSDSEVEYVIECLKKSL